MVLFSSSMRALAELRRKTCRAAVWSCVIAVCLLTVTVMGLWWYRHVTILTQSRLETAKAIMLFVLEQERKSSDSPSSLVNLSLYGDAFVQAKRDVENPFLVLDVMKGIAEKFFGEVPLIKLMPTPIVWLAVSFVFGTIALGFMYNTVVSFAYLIQQRQSDADSLAQIMAATSAFSKPSQPYYLGGSNSNNYNDRHHPSDNSQYPRSSLQRRRKGDPLEDNAPSGV